MLLPQTQTMQYRFLRRSRRLYGNQKSTLACRSSRSLQKIFETNRTIIWKAGFTRPVGQPLLYYVCVDRYNEPHYMKKSLESKTHTLTYDTCTWQSFLEGKDRDKLDTVIAKFEALCIGKTNTYINVRFMFIAVPGGCQLVPVTVLYFSSSV